MMAALFGIYGCALLALIKNRHDLAVGLFFTGWLLSILMFWHHVTDKLDIIL